MRLCCRCLYSGSWDYTVHMAPCCFLDSSNCVLQVPVQRVVGLHCACLVPQPPQVPVRHPLQRLGLGRLP